MQSFLRDQPPPLIHKYDLDQRLSTTNGKSDSQQPWEFVDWLKPLDPIRDEKPIIASAPAQEARPVSPQLSPVTPASDTKTAGPRQIPAASAPRQIPAASAPCQIPAASAPSQMPATSATEIRLAELSQKMADTIARSSLPPVMPDIFSGDIQRYPHWKRAYCTLTETVPMSPMERLIRLGQFVTGEPKQLVDRYANLYPSNPERAYADVWGAAR